MAISRLYRLRRWMSIDGGLRAPQGHAAQGNGEVAVGQSGVWNLAEALDSGSAHGFGSGSEGLGSSHYS